ncbi:hypothetical protein AK830_g4707 [Neonectria ditissima]|uniref:Peptidase S8/S53 domain-containing protein n=1 Tax=Neonectria ditissima TaxID=78410 RepID=A0A0P7AVA9_9HYPO|nr:hypothetical protein AK830_g4707 [Neonectria ditissima]
MSFSLEGDEGALYPVTKAIEDATHKKKLVFAAAANYRQNKKVPIGFPANMREHLFCINSHRGDTDQPSVFTPSAQSHSANFAVIGEGILGAWLDNAVTRKKGTSCSTPIAAGMAAIVLDYSRLLRRTDDDIESVWISQPRPPAGSEATLGDVAEPESSEEVNQLQDTQAMKQIFFYLMAAGTRSYGQAQYSYIKPWFLFDPSKTKSWTAGQMATVIQNKQDWIFIA